MHVFQECPPVSSAELFVVADLQQSTRGRYTGGCVPVTFYEDMTLCVGTFWVQVVFDDGLESDLSIGAPGL